MSSIDPVPSSADLFPTSSEFMSSADPFPTSSDFMSSADLFPTISDSLDLFPISSDSMSSENPFPTSSGLLPAATDTTTAKGKFTVCGPAEFSLSYNCTGPSCSGLDGFPNTTCTTEGDILSCSNGVVCSGSPGYVSEFTFIQPRIIVFQSHEVDAGACGSFVVTTNGTTGGAQSVVKKYATSDCQVQKAQKSGERATRRPEHPVFLYLLVFLLCIFIQGTTALGQEAKHSVLSQDDLVSEIDTSPFNSMVPVHSRGDAALAPRSVNLVKDPEAFSKFWEKFANLLSEWLADKLDKATGDEKTFAENLIAEIEEAICNHLASDVVNKAIGVDLVETCIGTVLTGSLITGPGELAAVLAVGTACNYLVSQLTSAVVPGLKDAQDNLSEALCNAKKPCSKDMLTDAKNCGACGNVCSTGVCKNGACTSATCKGETCETFFTTCGAGGSCVCASTTEGTGYCIDGETRCSTLVECTQSTECAAGETCAQNTCCYTKVCVGSTFCGLSNAFSNGVSSGNSFGNSSGDSSATSTGSGLSQIPKRLLARYDYGPTIGSRRGIPRGHFH